MFSAQEMPADSRAMEEERGVKLPPQYYNDILITRTTPPPPLPFELSSRRRRRVNGSGGSPTTGKHVVDSVFIDFFVFFGLVI